MRPFNERVLGRSPTDKDDEQFGMARGGLGGRIEQQIEPVGRTVRSGIDRDDASESLSIPEYVAERRRHEVLRVGGVRDELDAVRIHASFDDVRPHALR
jgi:hypothetical protein